MIETGESRDRIDSSRMHRTEAVSHSRTEPHLNGAWLRLVQMESPRNPSTASHRRRQELSLLQAR